MQVTRVKDLGNPAAWSMHRMYASSSRQLIPRIICGSEYSPRYAVFGCGRRTRRKCGNILGTHSVNVKRLRFGAIRLFAFQRIGIEFRIFSNLPSMRCPSPKNTICILFRSADGFTAAYPMLWQAGRELLESQPHS